MTHQLHGAQPLLMFMKTDVSLSCLQDLAFGPYPEPKASSQRFSFLFLSDPFNITLPVTLVFFKLSLSLKFRNQVKEYRYCRTDRKNI